jgi:aryl carrier-like protein
MIQASEIETELLTFLRRDIFSPDTNLTPETDLVGAGFDSMSLVKTLLQVDSRRRNHGRCAGEHPRARRDGRPHPE